MLVANKSPWQSASWAWWSLPPRWWCAFAAGAALVVPVAVTVLAARATGPSSRPAWRPVSAWVLLVAIGAAILRCRLYGLDRIVSCTLAYGLLTVLLGGGYAGVLFGLGQLLGRTSSLAVAVVTLAVAAAFQPARGRVQELVDRRFSRHRYDAARTDRRCSRTRAHAWGTRAALTSAARAAGSPAARR